MSRPRPDGYMRGAAGCLSLAAAPTFAVMAVLTGAPGGSDPSPICRAAADPSPFGGMAAMYLLMSVFHSASWLKLIDRRQGGRDRR